MVIVKFCTNDLEQKNGYSIVQIMLMSNFALLFKLSLMQLVFVGMAMIPIAGLVTLLGLELVYMGVTIVLFLKHRRLSNLILAIPKFIQSVLLMLVEILLLLYFAKLQKAEFSLTKSQQKNLTNLIFASNLVEYAFLGLGIFIIAKIYCDRNKKQMADARYKRYLRDRTSALVYK